MSAAEPPLVSLPKIGADDLEAPPLSPRQMAWRRFRRHKMAMVSAVIVILLFLYSFAGMLAYSEAQANATDTSLRLNGPSREHLFGTDTVGRDIIARFDLWRTDFLVYCVNGRYPETVIGILVGATAVYYGGQNRQHPHAFHRSRPHHPPTLLTHRHG
ncbi:MAG: hypothetical protein M5U34_40300 [Chloroflexi bacterium]|nr:hypothetical protein [Chloroflexota bacterium]